LGQFIYFLNQNCSIWRKIIHQIFKFWEKSPFLVQILPSFEVMSLFHF
jgi:hypothetical protein